jgi:hypothetical protein
MKQMLWNLLRRITMMLYHSILKRFHVGHLNSSMIFSSERVVSRDRRDIERILFRCGLSSYDVLKIAEITRGIHPKDLLWIANSEDEKLETVLT